MSKKIILIVLFTIIFLISGVLIFFNNSNQNNFDENENNFYSSGINLTFENRNSKFDDVEPLKKYDICEYDFGDGFYFEAQCNILVVNMLGWDFGEGVNQDIFKKEFNNLIDKIKKYDARIIGTINGINVINIELQNDKNIDVIKKDFSESDYVNVLYDMVVGLDSLD